MSNEVTEKPSGVESKPNTTVGRSFSFTSGGPREGGQTFSQTGETRQTEVEAAEVAAEAVGLELPEGVTPAAYKAMKEAGLLKDAGAPEAGAGDEPTTEPSESSDTPESLEDLRPKDEAPSPIETIQTYSKEWYENEGKLSDESREAIKKKHNLDDEALDLVMNAIATSGQARLQQTAAAALESWGYSVDQFKTWAEWSAKNETPEAQEARWEILRSNNPTTAKMGVDALKAAYEQANKSEPAMIRGESGAPIKGFDAILSEAMLNPLWKANGPAGDAFRSKIDKQLKQAKAAGKGPGTY